MKKHENTPAIIELKLQNWNNFGASMYAIEQSLIERSKMIVESLPKDGVIDDINAIESAIKEATNINNCVVVSGRMAITEKLEQVKKRLMLPENEAKDAIARCKQMLLILKNEKEAKEEEERKLQETKRKEKEALLKDAAEHYLKLKESATTLINKAYMHALGDGNIAPDAIPTYLLTVGRKLKALDVPFERLTDSVNNGFETDFNINNYIEKLKHKFEFYAQDYANKEAAKAIAEKHAEDEKLRIETERKNAELAAQLKASVHNAQPSLFHETKALKIDYEIEMEDTLDNALLCISAFVANKDILNSRTKSWFNFSAENAIVALISQKKKDPLFNPKGITFKEIKKL